MNSKPQIVVLFVLFWFKMNKRRKSSGPKVGGQRVYLGTYIPVHIIYLSIQVGLLLNTPPPHQSVCPRKRGATQPWISLHQRHQQYQQPHQLQPPRLRYGSIPNHTFIRGELQRSRGDNPGFFSAAERTRKA